MKNKYSPNWIIIVAILGVLGVVGLKSVEGVGANVNFSTNAAEAEVLSPNADGSGKTLTRYSIHCDVNGTLTLESSTSYGSYYMTDKGELGIEWNPQRKDVSYKLPGWCK